MFTLNDIQTIFPSYKGKLDGELTVKQIMTDSRKEQEEALFVPIIGETFNGHDFIYDAIKKGAVATLWDEEVEIPKNVPDTFCFFLVDDTMKALQKLAETYRNEVNPIVIGITGSNGKTTTKDLVTAVLQTKYRTFATIGNFNNHIGLPLTILQMPKQTEILALEMGMNHFGEIDVLTNIARPDYAIITNIGESHIEHLGSREGIAKAKLEIKNGLKENGTLIIDGDEPLLSPQFNEKNVRTCGFGENNNVVVSNIRIERDKTIFHIGDEQFSIPLLGKHHAKNASFVIALARELGLPSSSIQEGLNKLNYSKMRFEIIEGKNNVTLINDAYNASATSMKAAIDVVKQMQGYETKIAVLGNILELGTFAETLHRSVATVISDPIKIVYTFGDDAKLISDEVKKLQPTIVCEHFDSKQTLINALHDFLNENTIILFKASRGMAFEQLINELVE